MYYGVNENSKDPALSKEEYEYYLEEFLRFKYAYIKQGRNLYHIWKNHLWNLNKAHKNFKRYCKDCLGMTYFQVANLINASFVACMLIQLGYWILPRNMSVALELLKLDKEIETNTSTFEERLNHIWGIATTNYKENQITVKLIKDLINIHYEGIYDPPKSRMVKIDIDVADKLVMDSLEEQVSLSTYVNELNNRIEYLESELDYYQQNSDINSESINCTVDLEQKQDINEITQETVILHEIKETCQQLKFDYFTILQALTNEKMVKRIWYLLYPLDSQFKKLNLLDLCKRLETTKTTVMTKIAEGINKFESWTQTKDVNGWAWTYDKEQNYFYVIS
jgi:hypothetical protein